MISTVTAQCTGRGSGRTTGPRAATAPTAGTRADRAERDVAGPCGSEMLGLRRFPDRDRRNCLVRSGDHLAAGRSDRLIVGQPVGQERLAVADPGVGRRVGEPKDGNGLAALVQEAGLEEGAGNVWAVRREMIVARQFDEPEVVSANPAVEGERKLRRRRQDAAVRTWPGSTGRGKRRKQDARQVPKDRDAGKDGKPGGNSFAQTGRASHREIPFSMPSCCSARWAGRQSNPSDKVSLCGCESGMIVRRGAMHVACLPCR